MEMRTYCVPAVADEPDHLTLAHRAADRGTLYQVEVGARPSFTVIDGDPPASAWAVADGGRTRRNGERRRAELVVAGSTGALVVRPFRTVTVEVDGGHMAGATGREHGLAALPWCEEQGLSVGRSGRPARCGHEDGGDQRDDDGQTCGHQTLVCAGHSETPGRPAPAGHDARVRVPIASRTTTCRF